jgi:phage terminase large subunit GpA-like protein
VSHPPIRQRVLQRMARGVAPRRLLTVSQWADVELKVSTKQGDKSGQWVTANNPPLREPMDAMSVRSGVHDMVCMFPIQFGKTSLSISVIGYTMSHDPCPLLVCLPNEVTRDKWVAQKLQPSIDETPAMRRSLTSVASREAANTRTFKDFFGGQLYIEHAGTPGRLKLTSARRLIVDEVDEFAVNLSSGDDPLEMLEGRTSAFPTNYQRLYIGTPGLRSVSRMHWLWERSDQRRYHVPCPHCGHMQHLQWSGLHWAKHAQPGQRRRVWYVCAECGSEIDEYAKTDMIAAGRWIATNPGARIRGYHINALYYQLDLGPRWSDLVEKWLEVQGDPAKLKTFVNDRLAEPWEDKSTASVRANVVQERAEAYPLRTAPRGVIKITAGTDTQDDRLEVHIVGWGRGGAFWALDYVVLPGDPARPEVWAAHADLINSPITHDSGALMSIEATSIDMLGHRTEAVKEYVRQRRIRRPMASYGAKANTAPILSRAKLQDHDRRGRTDRHGVHVYQIGTVNAKHVLFARLAADHDAMRAWQARPESDDKPDAPPRLAHFSDQLDDSYFDGLISEVFDPSKNRFVRRRGAVRNEPLDTWVHAYAATHHPELRLHRARAADWDRWEAELLARAPKAEAAAPPAPAASDAPAARPAARPAEPAKKAVWHDYRNRKARL